MSFRKLKAQIYWPTTDQKVRGSNPFGRTIQATLADLTGVLRGNPLISPNTNLGLRGEIMITRQLFRVKKVVTIIFVLLFSAVGIQSSYADYYPTGIQQNVSEQTLIDNGWTKFYEQTYGTPIGQSTTAIRPSGQYVILSAKVADSTTILLAAAAPTASVFTETVINTPQLLNGAYWYLTLATTVPTEGSIGFAPTAVINQDSADFGTLGEQRLSWHLISDVGGYRIGNITDLNYSTAYLKQVWTWTPAPAPVYVRQTSNLTFTQSLYASDTLSDPDGELRKTVDQIMAKHGSLIK